MQQKLVVELQIDRQNILGENIHNYDLQINDKVIVFIDNCYEFAIVTSQERIDTKLRKPVGKIVRKATEQDLQHYEENKLKSQEVYRSIRQKVQSYELPIKIVYCRYSFDKSRLYVYYLAERQIELKNLIRELAHKYKTRIQMEQIGARDEAKIFGGIGVCGLELCCKKWIKKFESITVEMAKTQQLALNIPKLSGLCNRLKCCLYYEYDFYKECLKKFPKLGSKVKTPDGDGKVISIDCIKNLVNVELSLPNGEYVTKSYQLESVQVGLIEKIKHSMR